MLDTILARRSIRADFLDRPIPQEVVDQIVASGLSAPSSKNAQPWRIHVVTHANTLAEFADAVQHGTDAAHYAPIDPATGLQRQWESTVAESAQVLRSVRLALFVENRGEFSGGRRNVAAAAEDVRFDALVGYGLEMAGVGAAIQSMWLAATALGLAGVFMGDVAIAESLIGARLGFRGDLVGVLALAYATGSPVPKRIADDRVVHHDPRRECRDG